MLAYKKFRIKFMCSDGRILQLNNYWHSGILKPALMSLNGLWIQLFVVYGDVISLLLTFLELQYMDALVHFQFSAADG